MRQIDKDCSRELAAGSDDPDDFDPLVAVPLTATFALAFTCTVDLP
jgi:hypothetical protein